VHQTSPHPMEEILMATTQNKCPECGKIVHFVSRYGKRIPVSWVKTLKIHRLAGGGGGPVGVRTNSGLLCMVDGQEELVLHERVCRGGRT